MAEPLSKMFFQFVKIKFYLVVVIACDDTLLFWIEYAYLSEMKMSCCPVRAGCALLIGLKHIPAEVVVRCLSITQSTPVLDRES
jgi:hypothetical protein